MTRAAAVPQSVAAAVPQSVADAHSISKAECAPGHAFNLFFELWNPADWSIDDVPAAKAVALGKVLSLPQHSNDMLQAIVARQEQIKITDDVLTVHAEAVSPFATGLGIEHPTENGFAFLNPYGLPYLAGSGVKGVLRKAAEDKAAEGSDELKPEHVELLFGTDKQGPGFEQAEPIELRRGILTFWDVFPVPRSEAVAGGKGPALFRIDIMTPHHTGYLQKGKTPSDSESPIPIPFLAIEPGSLFNFAVTCQTHRFTEDMLPRPWKVIVESLFHDAFAWLGFGAKTAVGYGAMKNVTESRGSKWVDGQIAEISRKPGVAVRDVLFGKLLAATWAEIPDLATKASARAYIKQKWGKSWDEQLRGARRDARKNYGDDPG